METKLEALLSEIQAKADQAKMTAKRDYEAGMVDCQNGIYDKWYRYNHRDSGRAYDLGWVEQNKTTQNDTVQFIEENHIF